MGTDPEQLRPAEEPGAEEPEGDAGTGGDDAPQTGEAAREKGVDADENLAYADFAPNSPEGG